MNSLKQLMTNPGLKREFHELRHGAAAHEIDMIFFFSWDKNFYVINLTVVWI